MRKLFFPLLITFICFTSLSFAQTKNISIGIADEKVSNQSDIYPVDARPYLEWGREIANKARAENPNMFKEARMRKTSAWDYQVGDTRNFWGSDLTQTGNAQWYVVGSTCRGVGENCYVFVEDDMWGSRVNQASVDGIIDGFDNQTPADPTKGIFETLTGVFGNPPDIDNDPKIIILVQDIIDGFTGSGGYVAGYFWSYHNVPIEEGAPQSNEAEMYFLDADPAVLTTEAGIENSLNTCAHEFQHMINWNYNEAQLTFYDEGCSMVAEHICGYEFREQDSWANNTNVTLTDWDQGPHDVLADYSRAARFMLYYYEQFGADFMTKFVQSEDLGNAGVDDALGNLDTPTSRRFNDAVIENNILVDWFMANRLDNKSVNSGRWGYDLAGLTKGVPTIHLSPNVEVTTNNIESFGAKYISFVQGSNLTINFGATSSNVIIRAIKEADGYKVVEDVARGIDYNVPDFGTTYHTVTFVIVNKSQFGWNACPYTATGEDAGGGGTLELAHDLGLVPTGVLLSTPGDTLAVIFEGVDGMWIKTVKVALRQAGSVTGGIWRYDAFSPVTPLGEELIVPLTATSTIATRPPYPYPEPYNNWVEVDVDAQRIDASEDFVIGFVVEGTYENDGSGGNRVMITDYASQDFYYNLTYMQTPQGGVPGWYIFSNGSGGQYLYLVRAVVTDGTVDVELDGAVVPQSFALEQNYPNPFNPSTSIRYQLPEHSAVSVKVYDMIGREIATLVNEEKSAGTYEVYWNGENYAGNKVSSGVYFYTISTKDFVQTKKMVLMK